MSDLGMSVDELIAYISKTCLPTLLVEGTADRSLLRRVESELSKLGVDVLPVGGRDRLWEVYGRRSELLSAKVVFLRDRDEWVAVASESIFRLGGDQRVTFFLRISGSIRRGQNRLIQMCVARDGPDDIRLYSHFCLSGEGRLIDCDAQGRRPSLLRQLHDWIFGA